MEKQILKTEKEVKEFFVDFGKSYSWDTETTGLKYMELEIEGIQTHQRLHGEIQKEIQFLHTYVQFLYTLTLTLHITGCLMQRLCINIISLLKVSGYMTQ